jgi:ribonuclease Y
MESLTSPLTWVLLVVGIAAGYFVHRSLTAKEQQGAAVDVKAKVDAAQKEADTLIADAKIKASSILEAAQKDERERKEKADKAEERLLRREETLATQMANISMRETKLNEDFKKIEQLKAEALETQKKATEHLEKITGMKAEEAKSMIIKDITERYKGDIVTSIQKVERERRDEIEKKASEIITTSLMRYARSHVADVTTSVFHLPSEEIKGKIIGREGRNIKALERATGVEIVVDETPESIILSSFDPLRREIARMTLEKMIKDGRIQPARIEETVEGCKQELIKRMQDIGEQATMDVGVTGFPKEILQLLGRLHFRTSYGQNVLVHSVEMAHIAGMMARELGCNVDIAKKGALVHDIGKAISHEVEGTHVELGRKILAKYGVEQAVITAMESHHEDYPFTSPEAYIVTTADILSAGRPGARRDTVEQYIKRLKDLEEITSKFDGVKQAYALSAGREIRVFVIPEKIDDFAALDMARNIANKIQTEMKYPGEIKVNVIRETRAVEYAR